MIVSFVRIENNMTENGVYRMFYLGRNFVSGFLCTLKCKKTKKPLKTLKT